MAIESTFKDWRLVLVGFVMWCPFLFTSAQEQYFWQDACGGRISVRHSRSADSIVHHQLKHVITMHNVTQTELNTVFPRMPSTKRMNARYPWLRNKKFLKEMRKNGAYALVVFHKYLQTYAATIYTLKEIEIDSNATTINNRRRQRLLAREIGELKRLICEVESQIEPPLQKTTVLLQDVKIQLPHKLDMTNALIHYRGIFKNYNTFLKKSNKLLFPKQKKQLKKKGGKRRNGRGKKL